MRRASRARRSASTTTAAVAIRAWSNSSARVRVPGFGEIARFPCCRRHWPSPPTAANSLASEIAAADRRVDQRQVVVGRVDRRINRQRRATLGNREVRLALDKREVAQIVERIPGLRIEKDRRSIRAAGIVSQTEGVKNGAQGVPRRRRCRRVVDGAMRVGQSELWQPQSRQTRASASCVCACR